MARPIKYNPEEVLTQAMNLFWENGYESTSIQDIVKVTGLKPGSLYNLYGNKDGIFEAVLEVYSNNALVVAQKILEEEDDELKNIETFLREVLVASIANESTNGCLLVKTLLVISHKDMKIQNEITKVFKQVEGYLENTLTRAKNKGQTSIDTNIFSKFIVTTMYGAHVYYKANRNHENLEESVKLILKMMKC